MVRTWDASLQDWEDVDDAHDFRAILLGNGLSINLWSGYHYNSLFAEANLDGDPEAIFETVGTTNFEAVLERLTHTRDVLRAVDKRTAWVDDLYDQVREALFGAINRSHVPHWQLDDARRLEIAGHLERYASVFTLNYDLILYWSHLFAASPQIVDFFWGPGSTFDPFDADLFSGRTGVYYLHGGLHLWRNALTDQSGKWTHNGLAILDQVEGAYSATSPRQPLFVSEGTSIEKVRAIRRSDYLSFAYEALEEEERDTVVFGASLGPSDQHILAALNAGPRRTIAISVYPEGVAEEVIVRFKTQMSEALDDHQLRFFDSQTHPLGDPVLRIDPVPPTTL